MIGVTKIGTPIALALALSLMALPALACPGKAKMQDQSASGAPVQHPVVKPKTSA